MNEGARTRDEFPMSVRRTLANRVGNRCSNPNCARITSGPHDSVERDVNIGVAAHIHAASEGGPRWDASMSHEERRAISNAIWLCQSDAKLIDSDVSRFPPRLLREWKSDAERRARDELEGRVQHRASIGRIEQLLLSRRQSFLRCVRRWTALDVNDDVATLMATDVSIGRAAISIDDAIANGLTVIVGAFGTGKSLAAERLFQDVVDEAILQHDLPIPVFLDARNEKQLENALGAVEKESRRVFIIVDNAESIGADALERLLLRLEHIQSTAPGNAIVVTARVVSALRKQRHVVQIGPMGSLEATALLRQVAQGRPLAETAPEVADLLKWPILVILLGAYLSGRSTAVTPSVGDLLTFMADRAYQRVNADLADAKTLLKALAMRQTDAAGALVPLADVASYDQRRALIDCGFVTWDEATQKIGFTLPIFQQWFAAIAIDEGLVAVEDLAASDARLERWRTPLLFATNIASAEKVDQIMANLCLRSAGFASLLLTEARQKWFGDIRATEIDAIALGRRIRNAAAVWLQTLGKLGERSSVATGVEEVAHLAISLNSGVITLGWFRPGQSAQQVELLSSSISPATFGVRWRAVSSRQFVPGPTMPWYEMLLPTRDVINDVIKNRLLVAAHTMQSAEVAYQTALALVGDGSLSRQAIAISRLEGSPRYRDDVVRRVGGKYLPLGPLRDLVADLKQRSIEEVLPPWPGPDQPRHEMEMRAPDGTVFGKTSWIWDGYSNERTLERLHFVFENALMAYIALVDQFFSRFKTRLQLYASLPVDMHVELIRGPSPDSNGAPIGNVFYLPKARGGKSTVHVRLAQEPADIMQRLRDLEAEVLKRDPAMFEWASFTYATTVFDIFGDMPITEIAFSWLKDDFEKILPAAF